MMMIRMTLPRRIYDYFVRHWFISSLLMTIPAYWFVFIQFQGENTGLIDNKGAFTNPALIVFWVLFALSFVYAILKSASDKYDEDAKQSGQFVLSKMLEGINSAKQRKLRRYSNYIKDNFGKKSVTAYADIENPTDQIESILENIQVSLSEIFGIRRDDIGLSIIYRYNLGAEWNWLCTINIQNDLSLEDLINNDKTSARQIIDRKESYIFFPDKNVGFINEKYVQGKKDKSYGGIGSIICRDISIRNSNVFVQAVLSITTYGKQLCDISDSEAIMKIEQVLLPCYELRLTSELALLYIKEEMI
ncbi:MAG: hypothetical protein JSW64_14085 [Candidatus Zixiibacteriota bacterium]|nr:MAG: hypothetical protein JSW64_14085 [candidate division Zixibacteria bacterium]